MSRILTSTYSRLAVIGLAAACFLAFCGPAQAGAAEELKTVKAETRAIKAETKQRKAAAKLEEAKAKLEAARRELAQLKQPTS